MLLLHVQALRLPVFNFCRKVVSLGVSLHKNPVGEKCGRKGGENAALFSPSQSNYWGRPALWEAGFGVWMVWRSELEVLSPPPSALGQVDMGKKKKKNKYFTPKNISGLCVSESPSHESRRESGTGGKHQAGSVPLTVRFWG